ncbi:MAG TPA: patatin-like phospholipase family protein, partial [Terriglobia bacterium]|nr:patatin-like phospholipase family protein [Terriglobia bacterium]
MALADASDFSKVQEAEKVEIAVSRGKREDCAHKDGSIGLALSGGGIRSATFNLGVLQAMARVGFFPCVDYLSTVSGGGYIGSWLVAWI